MAAIQQYGVPISRPKGGVLYGPNGEILLGGTGVGGVGRYSRRFGPQEDVHLRSGDAPGSFAFVEAQENAMVTGNEYWDGTNWLRFDTAKAHNAFILSPAARTYIFRSGPVGANPITTWPGNTTLFHDVNGRTVLTADTHDAIFGSKGAWHQGANVGFDGTNWNRQNTANPAHMLVWRDTTAQYELFYVAAGANPITWTLVGTFTPQVLGLAMDPPRCQVRGGSISPASSTTWTPIPTGATVDYNSPGAAGGAAPWNNTSRVFTAPVTGWYHFDFDGSWGTGAGTIRGIAIFLNGNAYGNVYVPPVGGGNTTDMHTAVDIVLAAGTTVQPQTYQDSGGALGFNLKSFTGRYVGQL
jgi:hypothetical protein